MKILICNDDGIHSAGLTALKDGLSPLARVITIAPDRERSAASHALTIHRPLKIKNISPDVYSVDGTPADCVHLGLNALLRGDPPALVVSGINQGANMGDDTLYSGTVAAAREAAMLGVPSFAVSIVATSDFVFDGAAMFAKRLAAFLLETRLPPRTLLNVNVPNVSADHLPEYRYTRLGNRVYANEVHEKSDPKGETFYWIGGKEPSFTSLAGSDLEAIADGYISITPLGLDQTEQSLLEHLMKAPAHL